MNFKRWNPSDILFLSYNSVNNMGKKKKKKEKLTKFISNVRHFEILILFFFQPYLTNVELDL